MCRICGFVDLKYRISGRMLEEMNNLVKYGGPDDEGYVLSIIDDRIFQAKGCDTIPEKRHLINVKEIEKSFLGMAHRRLSILDLSESGHQPMVSDGQDYMITFNGEIYNFLELREELKMMGCKFKSSCDTEVILESYKKWGEKCVEKFIGMWAFAIYDKTNRILFCSRDRLGVKPFHYWCDQNGFIFSSELKQIAQIPFVKKTLNVDVFLTNFLFQMSDYNEETLIKEIKTLRPGHNLIVKISGEKIKVAEYSYWSLKIPKEKIKKDEVTVTKELENAIKKSLNYRLRSDIPIGGLLSGGLDSSSLLVLAREIEPRYKFETFTASYEKEGEQNYAEIINDFCQFNPNYIFPKCDDLKTQLENIVWHCEGIVNFGHIGFYSVLEAAANKKIHVLINGQCGDETLCGYERYYVYYFWELIKKFKLIKAIKEFKLSIKNSAISFKQMVSFFVYFNFPSIRIFVKKRLNNKILNPKLLSMFNQKNIKDLMKVKNLDELILKELTQTQLPRILRWDDRSYMAFSIESRVPLVDYQFIEYATKIPYELKIKKGYTKFVLRQCMKNKMPKEVVWRKNKMGFSAPNELWREQLTPEFYNSYFSEPICCKIFNVEELRKIMKENINSKVLKMAVVMIIFIKTFKVDIE